MMVPFFKKNWILRYVLVYFENTKNKKIFKKYKKQLFINNLGGLKEEISGPYEHQNMKEIIWEKS